MYKKIIMSCLLLLSLICTFSSQAEGSSKKVSLTRQYLTLTPDITTNFYTTGKTIHFVRIKVELVVANQQHLRLIEHNQPLIRNAIIDVIGQKTSSEIKSYNGRKKVRKECLDKVNEILLVETGQTILSDLLFSKYIYQ